MNLKFFMALLLISLLVPAGGSMLIPSGIDMQDNFWCEGGVTQADFFTSQISMALINDSLVGFARTNESIELAVYKNGEISFKDVLAVRVVPVIAGTVTTRLNESARFRSYPGMDVGLVLGVKPLVHFYALNLVASEDNSVVVAECRDKSVRWNIWLADRNGNTTLIENADPYIEIVRIRELGYGYSKVV